MSYWGTTNVQCTLMYDGHTFSTLNKMAKLSRNKIPRQHPGAVSRSARLIRSASLYEQNLMDSTTVDDRAILKQATENEKRLIQANIVRMNGVQTPAQWRMARVDQMLRNRSSSLTRTRPFMEASADNSAETSPKKQTSEREKKTQKTAPVKSNHLDKEVPSNKRTGPLAVMTKQPHPRTYIVDPAWNSEYMMSGKTRPGEVIARSIVPQRDIPTQ